MENPNHKWRFIAGKIIYKWAIYTMAFCMFTRGYPFFSMSISGTNLLEVPMSLGDVRKYPGKIWPEAPHTLG